MPRAFIMHSWYWKVRSRPPRDPPRVRRGACAPAWGMLEVWAPACFPFFLSGHSRLRRFDRLPGPKIKILGDGS